MTCSSPSASAPRPSLLVGIYLLLALAPLLFSALVQVRDRSMVGELAIGCGLVAMAMLLMQFISSGRYERISGRAGIDRTLRFHQLAAYGLFVLALLHPVLFMLPSDLSELSRFPSALVGMVGVPHLRSGVIALAVLVLLVPLGIFRRRLPVRYETWRGLHVLLAIAAAAASLHHAFSVGSYSRSLMMMFYWAVLAAIALGALGYVYLVKPARLAKAAYRVKSNDERGGDIREIVLEPTGPRTLSYAAGQFVWVSFGRWPFPLIDHPYSLASSPREGPELRLLIKARGDFSSAAAAIAPGTLAYVDGPHGDLTLAGRKAEAIALYAGGIGVAPILGVLRDLRLAGDKRPVRLVYGARNLDRLVGRDVIAVAAQTLDFSVDYVLEQAPPDWKGSTGAITPQQVLQAIKGRDPHRCLCLLCGPTPMMLSAERVLLDAGVPPQNIIYERFEYD